MPKLLLKSLAVLILTGLWLGPTSFGAQPANESPEDNSGKRQEPAAQQAEAAEKGRRRSGDLRIPDKLNVGDPAPGFCLKTIDDKQTVSLSDYRGKRPVVLIFGSYT
jgi:hypothetical protein